MAAWTKSLTVNEPTIDKQHQALLETITTLIGSLEQFDSSEELLKLSRNIFHELHTYIHEHFSYEEKYMEKNKYPRLEEHKDLHREFTNFFEKFKTDLNQKLAISNASQRPLGKDLKILCDETKEYLLGWWIKHIRLEDQKYAKFIASKT